MNDRLDLTVTTWLRDEAPAKASANVLTDAMARVSTLDQERYVTQRILGDRIGRRRDVRLVLALALVALVLGGAAIAIGALLPRQTVPIGLSTDVIVFMANGDAGSDLTGEVTDVRGGDRDLYRIDADGSIRRIAGDDADELSQRCPTISPDGRYLAYHEVDVTTVTPTQAPVPEGQSFGPAPANVGPIRQGIVVVPLDEHGTPTGEPRTIVAPVPPENGVECPHWSPDGQSVAFIVIGDEPGSGSPENATRIWVAPLDGELTALDVEPANSDWNFDWSPDGSQLVVADNDNAWLVPADGSERRLLLGGGAALADWSPDGSRIAVSANSGTLIVLDRDGREIFRRVPRGEASESYAAWSPDSRWIAQVRDGEVQLDSADGQDSRSIAIERDVSSLGWAYLDQGLTFGLIGWSPDGTELLVMATDFDAFALVLVDALGDRPARALVGPTYALFGTGPDDVSWEGPDQ